MAAKLGIIAGRGPVPRKLIESCQAEGRPHFVIALNGETQRETVAGTDHSWQDIAAVGAILKRLQSEGCGEIVLIGPIDKPDLQHLKPDWQGLKLLPKVIAAARRGDDAILTVVVAELERNGLRVVAAEEILRDLAAQPGCLTKRAPTEVDWRDVARGREVLHALSPLDIGQAVVVRAGLVLAIEAAEGTDGMLARCREFAGPQAGGVLIKAPKSGQERRVDLPTIGPDTVDGVATAGLVGIAVEAGGALIVDRDEIKRRADDRDLFVVAFARTRE